MQGLQRHEEALDGYDRILAIQPRDAGAHSNRGNTLMTWAGWKRRWPPLTRRRQSQPDIFIVHNNRGNALKELGRLTKAVAALDRALALQPDFSAAYFNRGKALCQSHQIADAFCDFMKSAELAAGTAVWPAEGQAPEAYRARHDREQQDYRAAIGGKTNAGLAIEGGGRLKAPAINPVNVASAAQQWRTKRPQIAVIDNFLSDEALGRAAPLLLGLDRVAHQLIERGYLGAVPEHGFASPLLAQIADEFRTAYADICGNHALKYLWAFKYDSTLDGVGIHADDAAVNVNFWITPDEANLDPQRGGLVVWDVAAPLDWEYSRYNGDLAATRDFLKRTNAKPVTIPYLCNRAVIFDFRPVSRNRHHPVQGGLFEPPHQCDVPVRRSDGTLTGYRSASWATSGICRPQNEKAGWFCHPAFCFQGHWPLAWARGFRRSHRSTGPASLHAR